MIENTTIEYKSLMKIIDTSSKLKSEGLRDLAITCVAFANSKINVKPTLKTIEQPRLKALIEEILRLSPNLTANEIQLKLGDVTIEDVRKSIYKLVELGILEHSNGKTYRKYFLAKKIEAT